MMKKVKCIFAPNVHTGGGFTLLKMLIPLFSGNKVNLVLDERGKPKLPESIQNVASFFHPTILGRLRAELRLFQITGVNEVLCFHSLPPLMPFKGNVYVFFQNVNILNFDGLGSDRVFVRVRLLIERFIFKSCKGRVNRFFVQTPTVKQLLVEKGKVEPDRVEVLPFYVQGTVSRVHSQGVRDGFVYVADGIRHKNHHNLIEAWSILSEHGFYPNLKVTLGERDKKLWLKLKQIIGERKLNIENVGHLPFVEVETLYQSAEALIFPSLKESFGLPLIEAGRYGLPVIAPEMDYVRDVCCPVETFDPLSPRSIARAVRRFKGWEEEPVSIATPEEFLQNIFHDC